MKARSIALGAALAVLSSGAATPAFAIGNVLTPISGADFKQISSSGTLGRSNGSVTNTNTSLPLTVGASLGKAEGSSQQFTVVGTGNSKTISCTVTATPVGLSDGPSFTTTRSIVAGSSTFQLVINAAANGPSESFYSIDCVLPPALPGLAPKIIGVFPASVTPQLLRPVTGDAFHNLPGSAGLAYHALGYMLNSTGVPVTVEASLGRYNGTPTMQIFGQNGGNPLRCDVFVQPESGAAAQVFSGTTTATGMFQLNIPTGSGGVIAYFTVRCTLPGVGARSAAILGVAPDRAGSSLFAGLSGYYFDPLFPESTPAISWSGGSVVASSDGQYVEASVGHAAGGPAPIFVYGQFDRFIGTGAGVTCNIYAVNQASGSILGPWTGSAPTGTGQLTRWRLEASPNAPSGGGYFYTMRCLLPRAATINGIQ